MDKHLVFVMINIETTLEALLILGSFLLPLRPRQQCLIRGGFLIDKDELLLRCGAWFRSGVILHYIHKSVGVQQFLVHLVASL